MNRVYEIFEVLPSGSPQGVSVVAGLEFVKVVLERLAMRTTNECFAADANTHQLVMQMNVPLTSFARIFQIAYDEPTALRRAELLRSRGYGVISVSGNEPAKVLLSSIQRYDLFIVGHAAPEETRKEMVDWLKVHYPGVRILALNPPDHQVLNADFNVRQNGPENWLPIVFRELANFAGGRGPTKASTGGA